MTADALSELLGHNAPPPDLLVGEALTERLRDEHAALIRRKDDLLAAAQRVPAVTDDDAAGKVSDFIAQLKGCAKAADTARVGEKEPYLAGGRSVDGFFKGIISPIEDVEKKVRNSLTIYHREKEAEERRRRMEAERIAREEAEARRREAEDAARALRDQQSLEDAIAADKAARLAEADAVKAAQAAAAKPADLSRIRGEYGAVSSLRTEWVFEGLDRHQIDLEALRHHFTTAAIESAIRAFIKAGGRQLEGVRIYETTVANVR